MSSGPYEYQAFELPQTTPNITPDEMQQRVVEAGYTPKVVGQYSFPHGKWQIKVAEEGITKETLKNAINATSGAKLSVSPSNTTISGDGVATAQVAVTDSRGASAQGSVVKLKVTKGPGVPVDATSKVLDANGQAVFTFGPSPSSGWLSPRTTLCAERQDKSALACGFTVEFTG